MIQNDLGLRIPILVITTFWVGGLSIPDPGLPTGRINAVADDGHIDVVSQVSRTTRAGPERGRGQVRSAGSVVERRSVIACDGNQLELAQPLETMCAEATAMCQSTIDDPRIMVWYYTRNPGQPWQRAGQACVPLAQANAAAGAAVPVVTGEDFRRLPLPAGVVHIQPGSGRTLVNVPTNVYVAAGAVVIPTVVLGQPVQVRATPVRYLWTFGDGSRLATTDPGAPYPDLRTTHTYTAPGAVGIGLTTTYRGEYSVAGGPWLPVDGTADVVTPAVPLVVVAARAELVADLLPSS